MTYHYAVTMMMVIGRRPLAAPGERVSTGSVENLEEKPPPGHLKRRFCDKLMLIAHIAVHGRGSTLRRSLVSFILMLVMISAGPAAAIDQRVLERIAEAYEAGVFSVRVDIHEPNPRVTSMQSPTVFSNGWRHHNPGGPVLFPAGSLVEVTALFNYSERGFFLELAEVREEDTPVTERKRLRIRFMIEPGITALDEQAEKAIELIDMVLRPVEP